MTTSDPYESGDIKNADGTESPRNLDELLKLDTFQGMTDDEIRLLIAYKVKQALSYSTEQHERELVKFMSEYNSERSGEMLQQAQANFERAINLVVDFKAVDE